MLANSCDQFHMGQLLAAARRKLTYTSGRWPLAVAVIVALLALGAVVWSVRQVGDQILDLKIMYTPTEATEILEALRPEGRQGYEDYLKIDVLFLLAYSYALVNVLFALFKNDRRVLFVLVPVATAVFDLVEDVSVYIALKAFPGSPQWSLALASVSGSLKHLGFALSLLFVLYGLLNKSAGISRSRESSVEQTYFALRLAAALFLLLLTASLAYQALKTPGACLKTSISAYYHTPAQAIFIGSLCAVGACLIVYRGRNDVENTLLDFTGFMAFIVAFVPIKPDGNCGGSTVAVEWSYVQNSTTALLGVGIVGAVAAMRFKTLRPAQAQLSTHARWALGITIAALIAGITWISVGPDSFNSSGHYVAAGALFLGIVSVVTLHAVGFARRAKGAGNLTRNWYLSVTIVMVVSLVVFVVARENGYVHWLLALEAALILAFAAFWLIQTYDHRGDVPTLRPPTASQDQQPDTRSSIAPQPEEGSAIAADGTQMQPFSPEQPR